MKAFVKDGLTVVVEDDDLRVPLYSANGWKETALPKKPKDEADKRTEQAIEDANASESNTASKSGNKKKAAATDKKVNEAVAATATAAAESEAVDDGLIKGGANNG